jgi:hypothetical protein
VVRSRPFIHPTRIYVDRGFENVVINRRVIDHRVNYGALDRYRSIHRDKDFSDVRRGPGNVPFHREPGAGEANRDNKIIRRNIDPNDPRIRENRGYGQAPQGPPVVKAEPPIARVPRTDVPPSQPNVPGREGRGRRPDFRTTQPVQPVQPAPKPQASVQLPPSRGPVFQRNQSSIDARDASRRGQMSREQINRPTAPSGPPPRQAGPVNQQQRQANPQAQQHRRPR